MENLERKYAFLDRDLTKEEIDSLVLTDSKKKKILLWILLVLELLCSGGLLAFGIVWIVINESDLQLVGGVFATFFGVGGVGGSLLFLVPFSSLRRYERILSDKIVSQAIRDTLGKEAYYFPNGEVGKDLLSELGISKIAIQKARDKIVYNEEGVRCLLVEVETEIPTVNKIGVIVAGTLMGGAAGALAGVASAIAQTADGQNENQSFKGVLYLASGVEKTIPQKIVLRTKDALGSLSASGLSPKDKIITDSTEFNKVMDLYCPDPSLAFYVLTPQMLEAFAGLAKECSGGLTVVFDKEYLAIAFSRKSLDISAIRKAKQDLDYKAMYEKITENLAPYKGLGKTLRLSYLAKNVFKAEKGIYR